MRSHIEFRSRALLQAGAADGQPNGERVARLLAAGLTRQGYDVITVAPEDWGWRVELKNKDFPLWIGCGHYEEYADGHLCFIEPSKGYVRRWFKRVDVTGVIEPLATALEQILRTEPQVSDIRWWTDEEVRTGAP